MKILFALLFATALTAAPMSQPQPYVVKDFSHLLGMKGFSNDLLSMHFKLYEGYVKNTNALIAQFQAMRDGGKVASYEFGALKRRFGWEFDGMRLHELYFGNLGGSGMNGTGQLAALIAAQYGSLDAWKKEFVACGLMRGIGWVVLMLDSEAGRLTTIWVNEHDVGHLATADLLIVMDVWEHAYMPQYGLDRAKYIDAFFANLDWDVAEGRYANTTASSVPSGAAKR